MDYKTFMELIKQIPPANCPTCGKDFKTAFIEYSATMFKFAYDKGYAKGLKENSWTTSKKS